MAFWEVSCIPWHVDKSNQCPASTPWAVIKDSDGSIVGCHDTEDDANGQLRALYANADGEQERSAGQWQALYGSLSRAEEWIVVTGPWGYVPPQQVGALHYVGEPVELLRALYRYRLSLSRSAEALEVVSGHLAAELHISAAELGELVQRSTLLSLPSAGWMGLVQACLFGIGTPAWQQAASRG
jgi:hypothetical protein